MLGVAAVAVVGGLAWGQAQSGDEAAERAVYDACTEAVGAQLAAALSVDPEPFRDAEITSLDGSDAFRVEVDVEASAEDGDSIDGRWTCVMEQATDGWRLTEDLTRS